jgi:transposase-like protein
VTHDDVLFGYRLQLFALAAERGVSQAGRLMGVHRSTYYRWKREVERSGLEMLRPRERRRPRMPNQLSVLVEQRIVAFALGHPARTAADRLTARPSLWRFLGCHPPQLSGTVPPLVLRMAVIMPPSHPLRLAWEPAMVNIPNAAWVLVMLHAPVRPS